MFFVITLSIVIFIISYSFLQNFHLFDSSRLPGPVRLPFIGSTLSFLLQKPEGNSNNNNNNNCNNSNTFNKKYLIIKSYEINIFFKLRFLK